MVLTARNCFDHITHALGGSTVLDCRDMVNQAGRYLVSMHPWKWLERPPVDLHLRANITFTDATWTTATKTITKTSGFTNYASTTHNSRFLNGDHVLITDGTNAQEGKYKIESVTANTLVTEEDIGADNAAADIDGEVILDSVRLPSDLAEIVGYDATQSLINSLELVPINRLLMLQTNQIQVTSFNFYGAIIWPEMDTTTPTAPEPILKIWPEPSADDARELTIYYRAGWTDISDDGDYIEVPVWMEALFIQLCRIWAKGYEEEDDADLNQRLLNIKASPIFEGCVRRDGMIQPDFGPMRGGAVESEPKGSNRFARSTVSGPS